MGGHKTISGGSYPTPAPPITHYTVTGIIEPDLTNDYYLTGIYNGKNYYADTELNVFLWWSISLSSWINSLSLGGIVLPYFKLNSPDIIGAYTPENGATGIATVSAGS